MTASSAASHLSQVPPDYERANCQIQGLLDHVPVGLCLIDDAFRVVGWNETLHKWTRIPVSKICGASLIASFPRLASQRYAARIRCVLETGAPAVFSAALHRHFLPVPAFQGAEGSLMVQETWIQRVSTSPLRVLISIQDVTAEFRQVDSLRSERTELNRVRNDLLTAHERLQAILKSATEVSIIATDPAGTITLFSRGAEQLLGYTASEMVGRHTPAVFHDRGEVELRGAELSNLLGRSITGFDVFIAVPSMQVAERREWTYICRDGTRKVVDLSVTAIRDEDGAIVGFVGTAVDVSVQKQSAQELARFAAEAAETRQRIELQAAELERQAFQLRDSQLQAESASRVKSEFLANMSHEIRTPMTAILGYTDLLLEDGDLHHAPPERIDALRTIRRSGDHLLGLINDILDLSKIEAGKMSVELIPCSPRQLVADVERLLRPRAVEQGIDLLMEFSGPVPAYVRSDPTRLRQVLVNLVGNAIKFTAEGGVHVLVRYLPGKNELLEFDVLDTGEGMTAEQAERLFRPFTQADSTTTRRHGGTGLGLTISRQLAQMLGGDLWLQYSTPGIGTMFRFTVAAVAAAASDTAPPAASAPVAATPGGLPAKAVSMTLSGCRVLLADDVPVNQKLVKHFLTKAGATVTVTSNGQEAVAEALAAWTALRPYDVILMDMLMPVMDGYQASTQLRASGYTGPIVALTANSMSSDREKCLAAGCDDFSSKPIDRNELIAKVASYCDRPLAETRSHADV